MIIVKLMGGLGNQMFQYAAGRRLSCVHDAQLKLDLSWFDNVENVDTSRRYELHVLNIKEDFASPDEVERLKRAGTGVLPGAIRRFISAFTPLNRQTMIRERHYHFDPHVLSLPDNVHLEGYWQSERYFKDIEETIRREFTIKIEPDDINRRLSEEIGNTESVSIHVRRGDYVSNPATASYHGACPPDYYREGVERVSLKVNRPHFFVFSDDPEWAKGNLRLAHPTTFIDNNRPSRAYEDLRLMSLCRHHIIANSSFSWWGAWLCQNPGKIVIAPGKWFNNPGIDTSDLLPASWVRI